MNVTVSFEKFARQLAGATEAQRAFVRHNKRDYRLPRRGWLNWRLKRKRG